MQEGTLTFNIFQPFYKHYNTTYSRNSNSVRYNAYINSGCAHTISTPYGYIIQDVHIQHLHHMQTIIQDVHTQHLHHMQEETSELTQG